MCELLVSNRTRNNRRGETVTIQDDGWPWSKRERRSGDFTILKVKDVDKRRFADLLAPKMARVNGEMVRVARKAKRIIDIDTAKTATTEEALRNWVGDY